jgi:Holliday junction resolvase RusA-like endonuclease
VNVTLPVAPVAKGRPRVSPAEYVVIHGKRVQTRKAHAWTPEATARYEEKIGWELRRARVHRTDNVPLGVHAVFFFPAEAPPDIDNVIKSLLDAGNSIAYGDDSQVKQLSAVVVEHDPQPRVKFTVYLLHGEAA